MISGNSKASQYSARETPNGSRVPQNSSMASAQVGMEAFRNLYTCGMYESCHYSFFMNTTVRIMQSFTYHSGTSLGIGSIHFSQLGLLQQPKASQCTLFLNLFIVRRITRHMNKDHFLFYIIYISDLHNRRILNHTA